MMAGRPYYLRVNSNIYYLIRIQKNAEKARNSAAVHKAAKEGDDCLFFHEQFTSSIHSVVQKYENL